MAFLFCMIYRTSSYLTENSYLHRFIDQYVSTIKIKNCCAVVQVIRTEQINYGVAGGKYSYL